MKDRIFEGFRRGERALQQPAVFAVALLLLVALIAIRLWPAVGGSWYRSGNDMEFILPAAKSATTTEIVRWLRGSWIGVELFNYYRPITSVFWYAEYRAFGENSAPWQMISLAMHGASTVSVALLLHRLFGSSLAALVGAVAFAFRPKILETLEWTPAQTDGFAVFFGTAALLLWQVFLDGLAKDRSRYGFLVVVGLLTLLAMGSKEIALTLPLLMALLVVRVPLPLKTKLALIGGLGGLLVAFFGWRYYCLGGMGFTPGSGVPGRANAVPLTFDRWFRQMWKFLLPPPLGPTTILSPLVPIAAYLTIILTLRMAKRPVKAVTATAGFAATTLLLGGPDFLFLPDTFPMIGEGLLAVAALVFVIRQKPREAAFVFAWGLLAHLPLYHVVYNAAGNVNYLPDTYRAFAFALLVLTLQAIFQQNDTLPTGRKP